MFRKAFGFLVLLAVVAGILSTAVRPTRADVDLSGKKGVVDPADLKKSDPPAPSLHIKEPPAPYTPPAPRQPSTAVAAVRD